MSEIIVRRDRRVEWIMRNRLHPQHDSFVTQPAEERGPSGLIRRYPHRVGFIGPNGIKRIDRLHGSGAPSFSVRSQGASAEVQLPLHTVAEPEYYIVVVPDMPGGRLSSHDRDVLGQAHQLVQQHGGAGAVMAVVFGTHRETQFDTAGADRLLNLSGEIYEGYCPEQKAAALSQVEAEYSPKHWLFPDSISGGFELGARLTALIGERPATQAWQVNSEETVCRAAGGRSDIKRATPRCLLLAEECAPQIDETRHEALEVQLQEATPIQTSIEDLGQVAIDPQSVPLTEAEFILSAGNGIHDWDQFHHAAQVLGATEGASRVAVDNGFMPRFRQVGATGSWVTARVYLAVGISGAIQHLQGIGGCDKVIAVNTDPGCDMVKRADLSVIADSNELLAALITLIEGHQKEELKDAA
ncbi:electron transfer flavoprotein subunit alpha [Vibrio mangrovi]|uniref:Electron transfer flavoprotein subunit alpha n=1 Tax=Vibrio mangrovi TaxID=474394 RepID=A0A1Y6IRF0_9VIBR|nr:electron transfer flavoprotein subunit alpha/FixB family protein [Vibrio mangrovi]MDW6004131.1 electron transfer flavoprotein subunit alpha/FixB family protein [Vibrio mangrovi]SMR99072.1 Electron transfer flavoprotein subunit alpha [Vibrio mangrovi]